MDSREFAKSLRQSMTDAEQLLWFRLRAHRLNGEKFRRQQPLGKYIVDFVHFSARLIVEADGGQHSGSERDAERDAWLEQQGFKVLRFWNNDILNNTDAVLAVIFEAVSRPLSPDPSPARGEGSKQTDAPSCAGDTGETSGTSDTSDTSDTNVDRL